jgi:hypothetical protein
MRYPESVQKGRIIVFHQNMLKIPTPPPLFSFKKCISVSSIKPRHSENISYKRVDKNFFFNFFYFFGQNNVLEGPEGLHITFFEKFR